MANNRKPKRTVLGNPKAPTPPKMMTKKTSPPSSMGPDTRDVTPDNDKKIGPPNRE